MPTSAFFNLSTSKKEEILKAAKEEFANNLYEDASINKIIKSIDMPRGTFYLYFENKEDIYSYIFEDYVKTLDNVFIKNLKASNGNIFNMYIKAFDFVTNKSNKEITTLINKFFLNINSKQLECAIPKKGKRNLHEEIKKNINYDVIKLDESEVYTLISILMPIFFHNVASVYRAPTYKDKIKEHYINQINIIKKGIESEDL